MTETFCNTYSKGVSARCPLLLGIVQAECDALGRVGDGVRYSAGRARPAHQTATTWATPAGPRDQTIADCPVSLLAMIPSAYWPSRGESRRPPVRVRRSGALLARPSPGNRIPGRGHHSLGQNGVSEFPPLSRTSVMAGWPAHAPLAQLRPLQAHSGAARRSMIRFGVKFPANSAGRLTRKRIMKSWVRRAYRFGGVRGTPDLAKASPRRA